MAYNKLVNGDQKETSPDALPAESSMVSKICETAWNHPYLTPMIAQVATSTFNALAPQRLKGAVTYVGNTIGTIPMAYMITQSASGLIGKGKSFFGY